MCNAVVDSIYLCPDIVMVRYHIISVAGRRGFSFNMSFSLLLHSEAPVRHVDPAEAVDQFFLLVFRRSKNSFFRLSQVGSLALLFCDLKRNDIARPLGLSHLVHQERSIAAVWAEGCSIRLVRSHKLRAALRAVIDPYVEYQALIGVFFHVVKPVRVIDIAAIAAFHLLGRDVECQICAASGTCNHSLYLLFS